ncbi:hypothetical protein EHI8A_165060 [Entamoeba histolytica HM-1:IMSS-B]|uniref:Uncharacterized protein n=6 Tax=Entamoeba histolytica TaxID=5759 RepID=C4LU95_ENTH1|nr:hypothetical protein EHI_110430 [Entamoeba histolytica HM-1:IMSS]EMD49454.1 Hypothetical protein EHI5A_191630 [Entamoeba histolytica KU27]EMH75468.1 hypothetical protein EHI8A_165060 [Entamoeba histolytica HM-1:IMSS-B]EMS14437.1 hypothetical protein KM1_239080 [Entamoeba histolytica HM-3:IMSS]ENY62558.1 hypothetical protein EHI7A_147320 [Entamoeba histolytica HM-1:IMSS-A]GAT92170.1 hypothetical protein CL6EHI_110430 [Entamoeba histolytica]|eukprot:XP_657053.1 hypothetical protein EHI_110430 [Entamoeba histolytica HM-1:IMSS]
MIVLVRVLKSENPQTIAERQIKLFNLITQKSSVIFSFTLTEIVYLVELRIEKETLITYVTENTLNKLKGWYEKKKEIETQPIIQNTEVGYSTQRILGIARSLVGPIGYLVLSNKDSQTKVEFKQENEVSGYFIKQYIDRLRLTQTRHHHQWNIDNEMIKSFSDEERKVIKIIINSVTNKKSYIQWSREKFTQFIPSFIHLLRGCGYLGSLAIICADELVSFYQSRMDSTNTLLKGFAPSSFWSSLTSQIPLSDETQIIYESIFNSSNIPYVDLAVFGNSSNLRLELLNQFDFIFVDSLTFNEIILETPVIMLNSPEPIPQGYSLEVISIMKNIHHKLLLPLSESQYEMIKWIASTIKFSQKEIVLKQLTTSIYYPQFSQIIPNSLLSPIDVFLPIFCSLCKTKRVCILYPSFSDIYYAFSQFDIPIVSNKIHDIHNINQFNSNLIQNIIISVDTPLTFSLNSVDIVISFDLLDTTAEQFINNKCTSSTPLYYVHLILDCSQFLYSTIIPNYSSDSYLNILQDSSTLPQHICLNQDFGSFVNYFQMNCCTFSSNTGIFQTLFPKLEDLNKIILVNQFKEEINRRTSHNSDQIKFEIAQLKENVNTHNTFSKKMEHYFSTTTQEQNTTTKKPSKPKEEDTTSKSLSIIREENNIKKPSMTKEVKINQTDDFKRTTQINKKHSLTHSSLENTETQPQNIETTTVENLKQIPKKITEEMIMKQIQSIFKSFMQESQKIKPFNFNLTCSGYAKQLIDTVQTVGTNRNRIIERCPELKVFTESQIDQATSSYLNCINTYRQELAETIQFINSIHLFLEKLNRGILTEFSRTDDPGWTYALDLLLIRSIATKGYKKMFECLSEIPIYVGLEKAGFCSQESKLEAVRRRIQHLKGYMK